MNKILYILFSFLLINCNTNTETRNNTGVDKNTSNYNSDTIALIDNKTYNLSIAKELELCYDELIAIEDDPDYFYPLCSDSNVRVFFMEPYYYITYNKALGYCGSCGCSLDVFKKTNKGFIQVNAWSCCSIDIKQEVNDHIIIKDQYKKSNCWPSFEGRFNIVNDRFNLIEIIKYTHNPLNEEHSVTCIYNNTKWLLKEFNN
jgi:hypothetical protein